MPKAVLPGGNRNEDVAEGQEGIPLKPIRKKPSGAGGGGEGSKAQAGKKNNESKELFSVLLLCKFCFGVTFVLMKAKERRARKMMKVKLYSLCFYCVGFVLGLL